MLTGSQEGNDGREPCRVAGQVALDFPFTLTLAWIIDLCELVRFRLRGVLVVGGMDLTVGAGKGP